MGIQFLTTHQCYLCYHSWRCPQLHLVGYNGCTIGVWIRWKLVLDTTVFLEYLPSNKQWLLTLLAGWWGVGQTVAGLVAWGFTGDYPYILSDTHSC